MNGNKYNIEQVVQFILEPGDESELFDRKMKIIIMMKYLHVIIIELTITKEILLKKKFKTVL